jgi:hypothetical protein
VRKLLAMIVMTAFLGSGALAVPAVAGAAPAQSHQVTVPFTGSSTFDLFTNGCSFAHQVYDATIGGSASGATLHLDGCVSLTNPFIFSGTFVITTAHLGQLTGTVTGPVGDASPTLCAADLFSSSLDFALTPTGATGAFHQTNGTVHLTGLWCSPTVPEVPGPISGTLTGPLPVPLAH